MSWNDPITEAQAALVKKLYLEIDPMLGADRARVWLSEPRNRHDASVHIDILIGESKAKRRHDADIAARAVPVTATVSAPARPDLTYPEPGYYAVFFEHTLRFYRVKEGKGRYTGRSFLDRFKSDELRNIRYPEKVEVLRLINADPDEAAMRFAVELTRCHVCGRMLTDEISRLRGIGPDCLGRRKDRDEIGMHALSDL